MQKNRGIKADNNDPAVRANAALFGERSQKNIGRVKLVMSLVYLFNEIQDIKQEKKYRILSDYFTKVLNESQLTDKERDLFYFEVKN